MFLIKRVVFFLLLMGAWLLWSGHYTLDAILHGKHVLVAIFGLASCITVAGIVYTFIKAAGDWKLIELGFRPLLYIPWLLWEIVKSNFHVAKIVLSPKMPISPRLIRVKASQRTDLGRVIYANSITLTPGTVTMDVRGEDFLVHALTKDTAAGVLTGEMDRKVTTMEGQQP